MPEAIATISCSACGKQYAWKSQYAGRMLHCSCGSSLRAPLRPNDAGALPRQAPQVIASSDGEASEDEFDRIVASAEYDVASEAPPAAAKPAQVAKPASGKVVVFVPGKKPGLGSVQDYLPEQPRKKAEAPAPSRLKEYYVPIALIAAGFAGSCILSATLGFSHIAYAAVFVVVECLINVVVAYVGIISAAKLLELSLGDMRSAILKIVAIALISGTATDALMIQATWMALACSMVVNTAGMACLFEIELQEVTMASGILWICKLVSLLMVMGVSVSSGGTLLRNIW